VLRQLYRSRTSTGWPAWSWGNDLKKTVMETF
jgi:hypothetical protein